MNRFVLLVLVLLLVAGLVLVAALFLAAYRQGPNFGP